MTAAGRRALVPALAGLAGCLDLGSTPWQPEGAADRAPDSPVVPSGTPGDGVTLVCPHEDGQPRPQDVVMVSTSFRPAHLEVCVGDPVTWTNRDDKEHTVYTGQPQAPDRLIVSHKLYFGDSFTWTFGSPGTYLYYCSTHGKKMRDASITVRE